MEEINNEEYTEETVSDLERFNIPYTKMLEEEKVADEIADWLERASESIITDDEEPIKTSGRVKK